jgi:hypothetical protein
VADINSSYERSRALIFQVFFVSNVRTGSMTIEDSVLRRNPSDGFETASLPGIFFLGARRPTVTSSTLD